MLLIAWPYLLIEKLYYFEGDIAGEEAACSFMLVVIFTCLNLKSELEAFAFSATAT